MIPSATQQMRLAQDLPSPPDTMTMHLWVEYEHDTDGDGASRSPRVHDGDAEQ